MWSQDTSERQTTTIPEYQIRETQEDSGFLSGSSSEDQHYHDSMRGYGAENADLELSESFIRNLSLKHTSINNLETSRALQMHHQQLHNHHHKSELIVEPTVANSNRFDGKWNEVDRIDILKQSYEFFFKQDSNGDTQLHISIVLSHLEASLWLIDSAPHACLLDIANDESQTALHLAVMIREPRVVRRLVLAGANTELRTLAGNTPLHLACALGDLACAKALTEPLSNLDRNWLASNGPMTQRQGSMGWNLELRNYVGKTCLHIAASKGYVDLVNQLIHLGAEVDTQEGLAGKTALHLAIENGHRQVVHYLVQKRRSCLDGVTYAGDTVYQIALDVDRKLAEDLLRFGASPALQRVDSSCSDSSLSDSSSSSNSSSSSSEDETDGF